MNEINFSIMLITKDPFYVCDNWKKKQIYSICRGGGFSQLCILHHPRFQKTDILKKTST